MRLDKYLKISRLIKRRGVAADACDSARVFVNSKIAKPSARLNVGDIIEIKYNSTPLRVRVLSLNEAVRKEDAQNMYEVLPPS